VTTTPGGGARFAYADPPYPGQAAKHYANHPDFAGEVDHRALLERLATYDGFVLHTSSTALAPVLAHASALFPDVRVGAWVKPFAAFKRNVPVAYAWEPVLFRPARKPRVSRDCVGRDWISEPITMRRGLAGAKPDAVCRWVFQVCGLRPNDIVDDLFPGTGAVTKAWRRWCGERDSRTQIDAPVQPWLLDGGA